MELSMYPFFTDILKREGAAAAIDFAGSCGFSAVEILEGARPGSRALFPSSEPAMILRQCLDRRGMHLACYSVSINILSDELGEERNLSGVEVLKRCAENACILGAPYLHHTLTIGYTPPHRGDIFPEILPKLLERAGEVAEFCDKLGLTVLYEPQGYYVNGSDGFPLFYDEMKQRGYNVGVCGDTGNPLYVDCDPVAFFERYAADIKHVHIKDIRVEDDILHRGNAAPSRRWDLSRGGTYLTDTYLGDGSVDLEACMEHLRRVGYAGAYSIETFYWNTLSVSLKENYKRDMDYIRTHFFEQGGQHGAWCHHFTQ